MLPVCSGSTGAVVVNFGTPELTLKCVSSILQWSVADPEDIFVVENASPDNSLAWLSRELPRGVRLVRRATNAGFAAGVNAGAALCKQEYILVLNPDTHFEDGSIDKALAELHSQPDIGLVGLDLVYPSGERQYSARRFYSVIDVLARRTAVGHLWPLRSRVDRHMMRSSWNTGTPFDAEWVMGTGFVVRRELFTYLGGMDEAYRLYMEDVDLCARIWQAGWRVVCVPGARLVHDHRRSSAAGLFSRAGQLHLRSLLHFRKKYRLPLWRPPGLPRLWRHASAPVRAGRDLISPGPHADG